MLAVVGYNLSRFHLSIDDTRDRVRASLRTVGRIAIPVVAFVGACMLLVGGYSLTTLALVNNYLGPEKHQNGRWHYWFIEALIQLTLLTTLLLAVPPVRRFERRFPYLFPLVLLAGALTFRYHWLVIEGLGNLRFRTHGVAWFFVLGWLAQRSSTPGKRAVTTAAVPAHHPRVLRPSRARMVRRPRHRPAGLEPRTCPCRAPPSGRSPPSPRRACGSTSATSGSGRPSIATSPRRRRTRSPSSPASPSGSSPCGSPSSGAAPAATSPECWNRGRHGAHCDRLMAARLLGPEHLAPAARKPVTANRWSSRAAFPTRVIGGSEVGQPWGVRRLSAGTGKGNGVIAEECPETRRSYESAARHRSPARRRYRTSPAPFGPQVAGITRATRDGRVRRPALAGSTATPIAESVVPSIWARSVSWGDLGAESLRSETVRAQKHE